MRNIRHKTRALDRPRFIHEKQKNLSLVLSNFSGDLCFLFCSNALILAPECRKCILRGPNFLNFPGEHTPGPSYPLAQVVHSPPTPKILPPTRILIENPGLVSWNRSRESCQELNIPLSSNSDKHLISPYGITTWSNMQVMRIKKMITNDQMSWFFIKFSPLVT